jgi:hypothetical protein
MLPPWLALFTFTQNTHKSSTTELLKQKKKIFWMTLYDLVVEEEVQEERDKVPQSNAKTKFPRSIWI